MKKLVVLIIIIIILIVFFFFHRQTGVYSEDFIKELYLGMSPLEVFEKFGEPDINLGTGVIIDGYYVADGYLVELYFGLSGEELKRVRILEGDANIYTKEENVVEVVFSSLME